MAHAVRPRSQLDERAEVLHADDLAGVDRADLDLLRQRLDLALAGLDGLAVRGGDHDGAVVLDIDADAVLLLQAADHLAAGADELADLLRVDVDGDEARGVHADAGTRRGKHALHDVDDLQPSLAGLLEGALDLCDREPAGLQVQLDAGDAVTRAGNLKVHIAEEILLADDVGDEDLVLVVLVGESPDGDPRDRGLDGHARVHQCKAAAADRGHRRGAVGLGDVAHDSDGVGELLGAGEHAHEGTLGQRAVADLAPARAGDALGLAGGEGREVVVQRELLGILGEQAVDDLLILTRPQRAGHERLRLAALEERRAVRALENADRALDGPELRGLSSVGAMPVLHDQPPGGLLFQPTQRVLGLGPTLGRARKRLVVAAGIDLEMVVERLGDERVHRLVPLLLPRQLAGHGHAVARKFLDQVRHFLRGQHPIARSLGLATELVQFLDQPERLLGRLIPGLDRAQHALLVHLGRAHLDHVDPVLVASEHQIKVGVFQLRHRGVDHIPQPVVRMHAPDAHRRRRSLVRRIAEGQRRARRRARQHVRVVLAVVAHHEALHLNLVHEAIREERAHGPIDHPHGQDFFLVRRALALAEPAGELARRGRLLAVIHRQREEVQPLARLGPHHRRQHRGAAIRGQHGRVAELGDLAGFQNQFASADVAFNAKLAESGCHDASTSAPIRCDWADPRGPSAGRAPKRLRKCGHRVSPADGRPEGRRRRAVWVLILGTPTLRVGSFQFDLHAERGGTQKQSNSRPPTATRSRVLERPLSPDYEKTRRSFDPRALCAYLRRPSFPISPVYRSWSSRARYFNSRLRRDTICVRPRRLWLSFRCP